jgi:hypothetical protein
MCRKVLEAASAQTGVTPAVNALEAHYTRRAAITAEEALSPELRFLLAAGYAVGVRKELTATLPKLPGIEATEVAGSLNGACVRFRWSL